MTAFTKTGKVRVNSVGIPEQFVTIASEWYGGHGCMLYAVASTGGLTTGTNCPIYDYASDKDRKRKHYLSIWRSLSCDIANAARAAEKGYNGPQDAIDAAVLRDFETWVDDTVIPMLEASYGLEDWDE